MKIIVIGAAGTIGTAIVEELGRRHDVASVGKSRGQYQADMTDYAQVQALFGKVGKADAVVVAAGIMALEPLADMTPERFRVGLNSKLMGQVHVALAAQHALNDGGSITLTSGIDVYHPIRHAANAVTSNAAVEGFVRGAAIELARGIRINAVTPGLLTESKEAYGHLFPGFETVPARRVALAYARSVEGAQTGQIYKVW